MGDHQNGHAVLALQVVEQVQYLPTQAHVQRRGRLIGNQQFGFTAQSHGDHGPLALPPAELMGKRACSPFWLGNTRLSQPIHGAIESLPAVKPFFEHQHFGNLVANGHQRV